MFPRVVGVCDLVYVARPQVREMQRCTDGFMWDVRFVGCVLLPVLDPGQPFFLDSKHQLTVDRESDSGVFEETIDAENDQSCLLLRDFSIK